MLLIGIMCMVSGAYSFWIIFGNPFMAIPFSAIWALIIVNLYRLVLITVGNPHIPHSPPYRFPFGSFVFRTFFLLTLGLFIVKPIEMLIMSPSIRPHLEMHRESVIAEHDARLQDFSIEGVESVFQTGDLFVTRANSGGYLMARMEILHREFPWIWAVTAILLWIFIWPFWSRIAWRKRSEYEISRGEIERNLVLREYNRFKETFIKGMLELTGRDDIWEEPFHDMPFCNEPIILQEQDVMRGGSVYAWARIMASENEPPEEVSNSNQPEDYIYLVGDFFAKYHGDRIPEASPGAATEYTVETYDHRVNNASYVWNPTLPQAGKSIPGLRTTFVAPSSASSKIPPDTANHSAKIYARHWSRISNWKGW